MEALTGTKQKKKIKKSNIELAIESNNTNDEENINYIRNQLNIRAKGDEVPGWVKPSLTFDNMSINQEIKEIILNNIEASDWKEPTPIQMQAIPSLLLKRDVLASAPTGSGKTAAFVTPMLSYITSSSTSSTRGIKGLILVPTKELGEQILSDTLRLSAGRKIKAKTLKKAHISLTIEQEKKMYNSIDILISTPMRLLGALMRKAVDLSAGKQLLFILTTLYNFLML